MSNIRTCFTSRFSSGRLLEIDFSQLEIYVLAYLSQDLALKTDLLSGEDLHGISATNLFGARYTKAQRKIAKQLSFQLQYGAGAKSMAESNGIPLATAKSFIDNYYARYTGVKNYHDHMLQVIDTNRTSGFGLKTLTGKPAGKSSYVSETGRIYTFIEQDAPEWVVRNTGRRTSFSPTKIKNYPVQGLATGDIVPLVLGKLHRALKSYSPAITDNVLMVNTVHDSVLFDCSDESYAVEWAKEAKVIMERAPQYMKEVFGIDFDLPLNVEAEVGKNWADMEVLTLD